MEIITYNGAYNQSGDFIDVMICIVDNNMKSNITFENTHNIRYSKNAGNYFELGAIWFATSKWNDISKFVIFHNTFQVLQQLPDDFLKQEYSPFWTACIGDYSPVLPWVHEQLHKLNIDVGYNMYWRNICGCYCVISTHILKSLIRVGCDQLYATTKSEAVGTEVLFGYLMHVYLNMNSKPLHEHPIVKYYHNIEDWIWISKDTGGQGRNEFQTKKHSLDASLLPNDIGTYTCKNKLLIHLLKYVQTSDDSILENILIQSYPDILILTKSYRNKQIIHSVLGALRHRLFTKKYLNDYFQEEYQQLINSEKLLW